MKVLPVLQYLMKFHKRQVLFQGRKLKIYVLFACLTWFPLVDKVNLWKYFSFFAPLWWRAENWLLLFEKLIFVVI